MDEENSTGTTGQRPEEIGRPFALTLLCLFSFIFFGLISVIYLTATLWSGTISDMVLRYAPENIHAPAIILIYTLGGFLLHGFAFTGVMMMWRMKRQGYIFFGLSALIISSYQLFAAQISPLTTAVYICQLVAFGLFLRKLR